jgi:phosphate transport system ATP-binding protein
MTATAPAVEIDIKHLHYGDFLAVRDTALGLGRNTVTALVGPSGCGKSTVLRCVNRMNDLVPGFRLDGSVKLRGAEVYAAGVDPVAVRRHVGMVFQQPNPFAKSVFDNVAFGPRLNGFKGDLEGLVRRALERAAVWTDVKDKLRSPATALSGGQQQRLCIARAIATDPEVLLMDEPCSALDPVATAQIEELIRELKARYTVAVVTHNLQQARRIADHTAFLYVDTTAGGRTGYLVEHGDTAQLFDDPKHPATRDYLQGKFG